MNGPHSSKRGLLLSGDLFFSSKITGTADGLGIPIEVESDPARALELMAAADYHCLILDLTTPGLSVSEFIDSLPDNRRPKLIAFGPHVQKAKLDEARAAGCEEVLPRSRFAATLPELLQQYLG